MTGVTTSGRYSGGFIAAAFVLSGFAYAPVYAGAGSAKISHVVIIVQENRTPDNLFQGLANADIASSGVDSHGNIVPLTQISLAAPYDISHAHSAFVTMYDGGKMDGADLESFFCKAFTPVSACPTAASEPQFAYVNASEVAPYMQLASTYTFADRMFQTNQGPSFAAHQYLLSGDGGMTNGSNLSVTENPRDPTGSLSSINGCNGPPGTNVLGIDMLGAETYRLPPCREVATLTDLLDTAAVSWRYYTPSAGAVWTAPSAIQHMRFGLPWSNVIAPETRVLTDIGNGVLAGVTWVIPVGATSDHAISTDGSGPSWVASVVNAIGNSPFWSNTAIIILWDDWGGWYDHVPPPSTISNELGFRVPLIVVSPYAKPAYVSHVTHDFGSVLSFVESIFGLPTLGKADARADDLSDCFDFTQTPLAFQTISASASASRFVSMPAASRKADPDDE